MRIKSTLALLRAWLGTMDFTGSIVRRPIYGRPDNKAPTHALSQSATRRRGLL